MSTPDLPLPSDAEPDVPVIVEPPPAPRSLWESPEIRGVLRYLYNHNPFYPISAALILAGLHQVFYDAESARDITAINFNSGILMAVIGCYAVLLAAIVCVIVRMGKVWDDARTILLTLVLLLVTLSINGDKPILMHAGLASAFLIGGLVFSLGLCETVLRLTGIRLPWLVRGPFYLLLALFFLYPVGLDYCLNTIGDTQNALGQRLTLLGVLLFPTVAGGIGLLLLPAAMRGPALMKENHTPWKWPLYPWSLFVILAVAVVLRAFYLTVSFHPRHGMESAFHVYFLTPFLLVVAAILFELGKSVGRVGPQQTALVSALFLLPLSLPGFPWAGPAADFMNLHRELFGAPIQVACVGVAALFAYAALRQGPAWTAEAVPYPIALLAFTRNDTLHINSFHEPMWWPLALAAVVMAIHTPFLPRSSFRWTAIASLAVASLAVGLKDTTFLASRGVIPIHLLLIAVIAISLAFNDDFAQLLRRLVAVVLIGFASGAVVYSLRLTFGLQSWAILAYVGILVATAWLIWSRLQGADQLTAAVLVSCAAAVQAGVMLMSAPEGVLLLVGGGVSLIAGTAISTSKVRVTRGQVPH